MSVINTVHLRQASFINTTNYNLPVIIKTGNAFTQLLKSFLIDHSRFT